MQRLIEIFGFSFIISILFFVLLIFIVKYEESNELHPVFIVAICLLVLLFFLCFPTLIVLYPIADFFFKRIEKSAKQEEYESCSTIMNAYDRSSNEYKERYESVMETNLWLHSEISVLKDSVSEWKDKYNTLLNEKAPIENPNSYIVYREHYRSGYNYGHLQGYYDGYTDCKSDIEKGIDRSDEIYEYLHPSNPDSTDDTSESLSE